MTLKGCSSFSIFFSFWQGLCAFFFFWQCFLSVAERISNKSESNLETASIISVPSFEAAERVRQSRSDTSSHPPVAAAAAAAEVRAANQPTSLINMLGYMMTWVRLPLRWPKSSWLVQSSCFSTCYLLSFSLCPCVLLVGCLRRDGSGRLCVSSCSVSSIWWSTIFQSLSILSLHDQFSSSRHHHVLLAYHCLFDSF